MLSFFFFRKKVTWIFVCLFWAFYSVNGKSIKANLNKMFLTEAFQKTNQLCRVGDRVCTPSPVSQTLVLSHVMIEILWGIGEVASA